MTLHWYQELFTITLNYQVQSKTFQQGIELVPEAETAALLKQFSHLIRTADGSLTLFFEGQETTGPPVRLETDQALPPNMLLIFKIFTDRNNQDLTERVGKKATSWGYPVLLSGKRTGNPRKITLINEKIVVRPARFPVEIRLAETGSQLPLQTLTVSNSNNITVYQETVRVSSDNYFRHPVDLTLSPPGIYTIRLGNFSAGCFADTGGTLNDCQGIVLITVTPQLEYAGTLRNKQFTTFEYTFGNNP